MSLWTAPKTHRTDSKLTVVVDAEGNDSRYEEKACFFLKQTWFPRNLCLKIVESPWFGNVTITGTVSILTSQARCVNISWCRNKLNVP